MKAYTRPSQAYMRIAGHPQGVAPGSGNGSQCEREAGHPPEAVTEASASAKQATRQGWPYYRRESRAAGGAVV